MSIIYPGVEELVPVQVKKEENEEKHADTGVNEASAGVNRKLAIELEVERIAKVQEQLQKELKELQDGNKSCNTDRDGLH